MAFVPLSPETLPSSLRFSMPTFRPARRACVPTRQTHPSPFRLSHAPIPSKSPPRSPPGSLVEV
eukprot:8202143-Prorocentrum_lima.AAC.1